MSTDDRTTGDRTTGDYPGLGAAVLMVASIAVSLIIAMTNRQLLPDRYFNDDLRLQNYIANPYLLTRDGSFKGTVEIYSFLHLDGKPLFVAFLAMALLLGGILFSLRETDEFRRSTGSVIVAAVGGPLGAVYLAQYSKELLVLPVMLLFIAKDRSRLILVAFVVTALLYSFEVRRYWFIVICAWIVLRVVLRRTRSTVVVASVLTALAVALAILLATGIGNSAGYGRASVLAQISVDPSTAIASPFGTAGYVASVGNTLYTLVTLIVPVPLLLNGAIYAAAGAAVFVLWLGIALVLRRNREPLGAGVLPVHLDAVAFLLGYVLTQSLFEPDYGSYIRHLTPFIPIFVLALKEQKWSRESSTSPSLSQLELSAPSRA